MWGVCSCVCGGGGSVASRLSPPRGPPLNVVHVCVGSQDLRPILEKAQDVIAYLEKPHAFNPVSAEVADGGASAGADGPAEVVSDAGADVTLSPQHTAQVVGAAHARGSVYTMPHPRSCKCDLASSRWPCVLSMSPPSPQPASPLPPLLRPVCVRRSPLLCVHVCHPRSGVKEGLPRVTARTVGVDDAAPRSAPLCHHCCRHLWTPPPPHTHTLPRPPRRRSSDSGCTCTGRALLYWWAT